ncbi:MAG: hypothetical protein SNJ52_03195 [Verrucomicrobiia bacterium]
MIEVPGFTTFRKGSLKHRPQGIACMESRMFESIMELELPGWQDFRVVSLDVQPKD